MKRDLTLGSVPKQLIRFAIPLFLANLFQSFYNIVDMVVVGRFIGSEGLAAVSSAVMISFIITSLCMGITMGGSVLVAHYAGAHETRKIQNTIGNLLFLSIVTAVVITLIGLALSESVLSFMRLPKAAFSYAVGYVRIICLGTIFTFGYNSVCSILRGLGDSRSPLIFVAVATIANIVLDVLFVGPLGWGVKGAALATIISQGISVLIALHHLKRHDVFSHFSVNDFILNRSLCGMILKIGFPAALQMVVVNLSYLLVTRMLNGYGVVIAAAAGIGLKINTFTAMPCWAVGQAVTTMAGQNMGAGRMERVKETTKTGLLISIIISCVLVVSVQLFASAIVSSFDTNKEVIREGVRYLRICCSVNFIAYASMYIFDSLATGVGDSLFAMINALLHSVVMRLSLSYLLGHVFGLGFIGIYWGEMLSPLLSFFVGTAYFLSGVWKRRKLDE